MKVDQKHIQFNKIQIEGFRSISSLEIDFDNFHGITLIKGENGSGKTSIVESVFWVLYGKNLKDTKSKQVQTWKQRRGDTWRGTRVVLDMKIDNQDVVIGRFIGFRGETNGLTIKDGIQIWINSQARQDQHVKDGQQTIDDLIGVDSTTFLNTVLFGQRMKRFVEADTKDKQTVFEHLLSIEWIDQAKQLASEKLNEIDQELSKVTRTRDHIEVTLKSKEHILSNQEEMIRTWNDNTKKGIEEAEKMLSEYANKYTSTLGTRIEIPEFDETFLNKLQEGNLSHKIRSKERLVEILENELREIKRAVQERVCQSCGQSLPNIDKHVSRGKQIMYSRTEMISQIDQMTSMEEKRLSWLSEELKKEKQWREAVQAKEKQKQELQYLKMNVEIWEKKLNEYQAHKMPKIDTGSVKVEIKDLQEKMKNADQVSKKVLQVRERVDFWNKTGFGNQGLKAFVIDQMLRELNQYLVQYCSRLGIWMSTSLLMDAKRKSLSIDCFIDGIQVDYNELSGGQKSRCDIALSFALHDMLSSTSVHFDCLFMDEFFENLDEKGLYIVFDMIREKATRNKIFIISHNQNLDMRNANQIEISLVEGQTNLT